MPRKLEVQLSTWLPQIVTAYDQYDVLTTISIVKSADGIFRVLGSAEEQLKEINNVWPILWQTKNSSKRILGQSGPVIGA